MRLRILGLFFAVLSPMNLFGQAIPPPVSPTPTPVQIQAPTPVPTPAPTPAKESEFGPLLPFQSGAAAGPVPVEINSDQTRLEGGIAVAEGNVVVRYSG